MYSRWTRKVPSMPTIVSLRNHAATLTGKEVLQKSLEKLWSEKATRTSPLTAEVTLNVALKFRLLDVAAGTVNVANSIWPFIRVSPSERICAVSWATMSSPSAVRRFVTGPPKRMTLPSPTGIKDIEEREVSDVF
jgi:hypothetical protein